MDPAKNRAITNNYQDAQLVSLKNWKRAHEFEDRDHGGPYIVSQTGYDPHDFQMRYNEFVLGRSGKWFTLSMFFKIPMDIRLQEFIFPRAAEVIEMMDNLTGKVRVEDGIPDPVFPEDEAEVQELNQAVVQARNSSPDL
jgi:hypothetical protein